MTSVRDERVTDLFFLDQTAEGNPTEEGLVRRVSGDLVAFINGSVKSLTTGTGLSEGQHDAFDKLLHNLDESYYLKITRSLGQVTNMTIWTDSGMTVKVRECVIARSSGKVSQIDAIQYDGVGSEVERLTAVFTRVSGQVDHVEVTRTTP